ncbi:PucR family transcriptional regulator ligand-binding domain-containing protein [Proteiniclasticum sp. SCR006]|uniref:PucR family transcriptional regulator ligand-binding domain-containing protein n=1 Tax=Proteiniclasticum aestuarii TaxID=2817862 RepID=A0A939HBQ9_9CLOT|nr:PucR family transcriptional regulator [Proteiniclasticum aestuarii]MBO1265518.1 PucR family transcriptional regulator ligand-binding domain-containing protein [Proteiniclasticum aestuarii]
MLTIRQFLKLSSFIDLKLLAGEKGLDHIITSVNIMDNPDALDWFSPGEMLVTSGYFFKDSREAQEKVMKQLKNINCPALCIKPKRYFGEIPECILRLGDEYGIPVIEIPYGLSFAKITTIVMAETLEKYDINNRKSLEIHEEFLRISLHGGGLRKICESLSSMIENPVVLMDKYWNVLHWDLQDDTHYDFENLLKLEVQKSFAGEPFIETLPPEFESLQKPLVRTLILEEQEIPFVLMPVSIGAVHHGYIMVLNTQKDLSDIDYIALENAAMSFALERIRNNELMRTKNRIRRDFFDDLLSGKIRDTENLQYLCEIHGLNPALSYTPMILDLEIFSSSSTDSLIDKKSFEDEKIKDTLRYLDHYKSDGNFVLHGFSQNTQIILFLGTNPKEFLSIQEMKAIAEEVLRKTEENIPQISIKMGIGKTSKSLLDLHKSFREAQEALRLIHMTPSEKKIYHFDDFLVHHFLEENINELKMRHFFESTLGPIHDYDLKYNSELLPTLETWIANHFNIAETARSLFTHRNTILYRIDRISTILQSDLKESDEILKYQLALKIYRLLDL